MPRPGCVQGLALKWIQSGEKDVGSLEQLQEFKLSYGAGEERDYLPWGRWPLARRCRGLRSRGLRRLRWSCSLNARPVYRWCGSTMPAAWMPAASPGCLGEQGREGTYTGLPGLAGYLPTNP